MSLSVKDQKEDGRIEDLNRGEMKGGVPVVVEEDLIAFLGSNSLSDPKSR